MPRIIGLDYGDKRVGIAATDPMQIIVTGLDTLSPDQALDFLGKYSQTEEIERIVIGLPLHPDGKPMAVFERIKKFADRLKKVLPQVPVEFHDEAHTSKKAVEVLIKSGYKKKKRRDKKLIDRMSAILILEDYLGIY